MEQNVIMRKRLLKQIIPAIILIIILGIGWRYPFLGFFIPVCMVCGIGISLFKGRKWCDWMCPRGSFNDTIGKAISPSKKIPAIFQNIYFRLTVIGIIMIIMIYQLQSRWQNLHSIGKFFIIMLTITTAISIILTILIHQRIWCYFCPVGTLSNLLGGRNNPMYIDSDKCNNCKICFKNCPMQIAPYSFKLQEKHIVKNNDCLKCNICIELCPKKALKR